MIKFKTIKYKHRVEAVKLQGQLNPEDPNQELIDKFVASLVQDWDYLDDETGDPIPPGEFDELTLEQYSLVMSEFNRAMNEQNVPKTNALPSRSGSTPSKTRKKQNQISQTG